MRLLPLVAIAAFAFITAAEERGFVPLFDGKTLTGWEGNRDVFRVENGEIVGGSMKSALPRNEFLCTTREFENFEGAQCGIDKPVVLHAEIGVLRHQERPDPDDDPTREWRSAKRSKT